MTDNFRESLVKNIALEEAEAARVESRLRAMRLALDAYDREFDKGSAASDPIQRTAENRFQGMRPVWKAIEIVMREHDGSMTRTDLEEALIKGGAMIGKPRSGNLLSSIEDSIKTGKMKQVGDRVIWLK
jgi:hypothetical protein